MSEWLNIRSKFLLFSILYFSQKFQFVYWNDILILSNINSFTVWGWVWRLNLTLYIHIYLQNRFKFDQTYNLTPVQFWLHRVQATWVDNFSYEYKIFPYIIPADLWSHFKINSTLHFCFKINFQQTANTSDENNNLRSAHWSVNRIFELFIFWTYTFCHKSRLYIGNIASIP